MVSSLPAGWGRPSPGSFFARLRERRRHHPEEFVCAVRVVAGEVPGESERWSYRPSGVDPLREGGVVTLTHGPGTQLRLRFTGEELPGGAGLRPNHVVWPAVEVDHDAHVEVAADEDEGVRLGTR